MRQFQLKMRGNFDLLRAFQIEQTHLRIGFAAIGDTQIQGIGSLIEEH
jgi:hypothetical protein